MNLTMLSLEIRRVLRDPVRLFFTAVLPAFFYVIFGPSQSYGDQSVGNGNVNALIMVAMAAYGAVSATVAVGGSAAVERSQGWSRQLGLTPLTDTQFVTVKAALAVIIAAVPIGLIFAIGAVSGARAEPWAWLASGAILLAGSTVFALYGLCFGLGFGSEAAVSAAGGSVVVLGFLGNIFFPLSGWMLALAKFTPLYGYAALARYPISEGNMYGNDGTVHHESIWLSLINVGAWFLVLALIATLLVRRGRKRL